MNLAPQPARAAGWTCPQCQGSNYYIVPLVPGDNLYGMFHLIRCVNDGCYYYETEAHSGGNATCYKEGTCEFCAVSYLVPHDFNNPRYASNGNGTHRAVCGNEGCNEVKPGEGAVACTRKGHDCTVDDTCNVCNGTIPAQSEHDFGNSRYVSNDNGTHKIECGNEGCKIGTGRDESCTYVDHDNNCTSPKQCQFCEYKDPSDTPASTHDYTNYVSNNNGTHQVKCSRDGCNDVKAQAESCSFEGGNTCTLCRYTKQSSSVQPPTPTAPPSEPAPTPAPTPKPTEKPAEKKFADVPDGEYFTAAVKWAVERNITTGTSDTMFSPRKDCTQSEILTFLYRANRGDGKASAADMAAAAAWAKELGMVGENFDESEPCTRATAVKFIWEAVGKPAAAGGTFTDVPADADYAEAVAWAVANGVTDGTGHGAFSPERVCNRAQIVTLLYRHFGK